VIATRRHWVIVASRDHARRGVEGGFVMTNHGKRSPLTRMSAGDSVFIYSSTTSYPHGEPLRAVTVVGEVTGEEPEPSDVIPDGFGRAASLREIEPLPLEEIREHLPVSRMRFRLFRARRGGRRGHLDPRGAAESLTNTTRRPTPSRVVTCRYSHA
jgi:EVE domain-containing protein